MKRVEIFLETLNDADFLEIKGGVIDGNETLVPDITEINNGSGCNCSQPINNGVGCNCHSLP